MKKYNYMLYTLMSIAMTNGYLIATANTSGKIMLSEQVSGPLKVGDVAYISVEEVIPGRVRYTKENLNAKVKHQKQTGLQYDAGKSTLGAPLPVINSPYGYILIEPIEEALAASTLGARTVPVKVIADLSTLGEKEFFKKAVEEGYIYPYGLTGEPVNMLEAKENPINDPLLWFANSIARKCNRASDSANESFTQARHPSYAEQFPVYVMDVSNTDEKFMEYRVAEQLRNNGFTGYDESMGNNPPRETVEQARQILKSNPVDGLRLIPEQTDYLKVNNGNICAQPVFEEEQEMHILPYENNVPELEEIIVEP